MSRHLFASLGLALLTGCQSGEAPSRTPTPSATPGAADDSPAALMAVAFPGWAPGRPHAVAVGTPEPSSGQVMDVQVAPARVVALDAQHRVLVVTGPPVTADGEPVASHANGANVGLYGFERRDGRWHRTFAQPSLAWTGFFGQAGELQAHPLGAGRWALSIENGSCWQGQCGRWLTLFSLSARGGQALAPVLQTQASAVGATLGCEEVLQGQPLPVDNPMPVTADTCYDISSRWRFEPATGPGWPALVLDFGGAEVAPADAASAPQRRSVQAQWVLRHDGQAYRPVQGRNPVRAF